MDNISQILIGNSSLFNILKNNFINKTFPQSIIFHGNQGIGKLTFSLYLIQQIYADLVEKNILNKQINLIYNYSHPNIKYVKKTFDENNNKLKQFITIDQIRNLENFIYQSSFDNLPKFVIIDSANDLNNNSSNSLLKILEEPKSNTFFILLSHQLSHILPTINSRCIKFYFEKHNINNFSKIINLHNKNLNSDEINFLFDISNGSPGFALELFTTDIMDFYNNIINILIERQSMSLKIINLSSHVSNYNNDQYKKYLMILRFILINVTKINLNYDFTKVFKSDLLINLKKLSNLIDNDICLKILEYMNNNENDLFKYNLDKKYFSLNIFSSLSRNI